MPDTADLRLFMGATLALNFTPGPDMLYVIARSGGCYLIYLGLKALLAREAGATRTAILRSSLKRVYRQGVVTNVLNPKVALFLGLGLRLACSPRT